MHKCPWLWSSSTFLKITCCHLNIYYNDWHIFIISHYFYTWLCAYVLVSAFTLMECLSVSFCAFLVNSRYRRALFNNCTEGTLLQYSPRRQKCPSQVPRGLQLFTSEGTLVATLGKNVTFLVFLEEVLTSLKQSNSCVYYRVVLV